MKIALLLLLLLSGCCAPQIESRDALLRAIRDDLQEKVIPQYKSYAAADDSRLPEVEEAEVFLLESTVEDIDKIVGPKAVPQ